MIESTIKYPTTIVADKSFRIVMKVLNVFEENCLRQPKVKIKQSNSDKIELPRALREKFWIYKWATPRGLAGIQVYIVAGAKT